MTGYLYGSAPGTYRPFVAGPNVPLVAPRNADLTEACIKCGHPHPTQIRTAEIVWVPPAVYFTLLISWVITLVAYLYMRKSSIHQVALCEPCAEEWDRAGWEGPVAAATGVFGTFGSLVLFGFGHTPLAIALLVGAPIIGIAGVLVSQRKRLTASLVDEHEVRLKGVSPHYPARPLLPPPGPYDQY